MGAGEAGMRGSWEGGAAAGSQPHTPAPRSHARPPGSGPVVVPWRSDHRGAHGAGASIPMPSRNRAESLPATNGRAAVMTTRAFSGVRTSTSTDPTASRAGPSCSRASPPRTRRRSRRPATGRTRSSPSGPAGRAPGCPGRGARPGTPTAAGAPCRPARRTGRRTRARASELDGLREVVRRDGHELRHAVDAAERLRGDGVGPRGGDGERSKAGNVSVMRAACALTSRQGQAPARASSASSAYTTPSTQPRSRCRSRAPLRPRAASLRAP